MFIIEAYSTAVLFCVVTMLCWGSWANTQKLAAGSWRFELFYWDCVLGIVALALISALTLGSFGEGGRPFLDDVQQADTANIGSALWGGVLFNAAISCWSRLFPLRVCPWRSRWVLGWGW